MKCNLGEVTFDIPLATGEFKHRTLDLGHKSDDDIGLFIEYDYKIGELKNLVVKSSLSVKSIEEWESKFIPMLQMILTLDPIALNVF